jgi:hypothetical protein
LCLLAELNALGKYASYTTAEEKAK